MDMKKIPEIKVAANKERDDDKKGGLLLALSRLTAGSGSSVLGGSLGTGIMATKAGVIGLALAVTTTAGSVGFIGYKIFGPGASDRTGVSFSLFEPKPKSSAEPSSAEPAKTGGAPSASLNYLTKANAGSDYGAAARAQEEAAAKASQAGASGAASSAAGQAASASVGSGQNNNAAPGARPGSLLKTDSKIGQLSQMGAGAASGAKAEAAGAAAKDLLAAVPKGGQVSGFDKGATNPTAVAGRRALSSGVRSLGAFRQLGQVKSDQVGAASSQKAGTTYDGNRTVAAGGSTIGPDAGIPQGGAGVEGAGARSNNNPTSASNNGSDRFNPPPSIGGVNVTPWQSAIKTAAILVAISAVLLFVLYKLKETGTDKYNYLAYAIMGLLAVLGLATIVLGSMMAGGQYGQLFQGNMFVLAGGFIVGAAAAGYFYFDGDGGGLPLMIMALSGAAALGSAIWGYLSTPKVYSPSVFKDGKPPDINNSKYGQYRHPAEKYLEKFIV